MSKQEKDGDSRKTYLLRVASHILSLNLVEEKLPNVQALYNFCDTPTPVLAISRSDQKGHIELANDIRFDKPALFRVIFYKARPTVLSAENYKSEVSVTTIHENANEALLATIHQVFSKMFAQQKDMKGQNQIAGLVNELEENLLLAVDTSKSGVEGVVSLEDEFKLWNARRSAGKDPGHYADTFDPVAEKLNLLEGIPIEEVMEFIEAAEDCVDALWNSEEPYPQKRMKQLIQAFENKIFETISSKFDSKTVWRSDRSADELRTAISICDQWLFSVNLLTSQTWPRNPLHEWEGDPMRVEFFKGFRNRLDETLSLKILTNQVADLLKDRSVQIKIVETVEGAMKGFDPVHYSPFTESQWRSRLQTVERALDPLIDRAIPLLKTRFQPSKMDSNLIIEDIHKYRHFLSRSNVKAKLLADRETLVSRLLDSLKLKKKEYNDRIRMSDIVVGRYLTEIAAKLIWIRQQTAQMEKLQKTCATLLDDIPLYGNLDGQIKDFIAELKSAESEQFDSWCREISQAIDDRSDPVALQTTGRLMVLEKERGSLNVSYSDRLVRLIREVRQLLSIGFPIPPKILQCVTVGEQFYRHGILLKQVAHFYNTIEQQMLPCQQALMLDEALAFERLVIPGKNSDASVMNVTWEDPQKLQSYIERLQEAALKLTNHNRRLRKIHMEMVEKAIKLMSIDLIKEEDKWSSVMSEIRQKFADEERHVSNKSNMRPWAIHWDRQLYKVLQLHFQWGLESLQSMIPAINAQLVFREQKLQLRPPLEELKQKYYKEMRKFMSIPQRFRGIQNSEKESSFFVAMIARNAARFQGIYERSVRLFEKVETIDKQFEDWVVLGQVNMEDLIEENFKKASDWEAELKSLKSKGRDVERLPNEIRIECILISTYSVKSTIEDLLHRMYDTLTWTLRHSITTELQVIGQTLSQGIDLLSIRPQSLDEVAEANQNHMKLMKSNREIREQMALLEEKNQLLRSVGGTGVESLGSTKSQFEKFDTMLETHEEVIKEQLDVMKSNVSDRIRLLNEEAERLSARWHQFKPKSEILNEDRAALVKALEFIREKRQQFDELNTNKEKIVNDCTQFDIEVPEFTILDEMQKDLEDYENNYLLYEKFNDDLQKLAGEEWILFRSKTYLFDEFLSNWTEQLKQIQPTPITVRLQKDIDSMREFSACLKYCRGEMLSGDHWLELFRLVKLPKGTTLERLTFGDLLSVQANIVENIENLKNLNSRAQGEVTIREAIQELEVWAAQAEFSLTEYKHSNGTSMKIIRDWKDAINQVKDNQALLMSLKNSPYYTQFKDQTSIWEKRITDLDVFLAMMNEIQRKWVYLEPIFGRGSLPSEAARFNRVDVEFRVILQDIAKDSRLVALCNRSSLGRTLEQLVDQLNRCQRALNEFLEEKRTIFPRFYFLGDDDLLEILGQSTNPTVIQSHLKKLFQGKPESEPGPESDQEVLDEEVMDID